MALIWVLDYLSGEISHSFGNCVYVYTDATKWNRLASAPCLICLSFCWKYGDYGTVHYHLAKPQHMLQLCRRTTLFSIPIWVILVRWMLLWPIYESRPEVFCHKLQLQNRSVRGFVLDVVVFFWILISVHLSSTEYWHMDPRHWEDEAENENFVANSGIRIVGLFVGLSHSFLKFHIIFIEFDYCHSFYFFLCCCYEHSWLWLLF